MKCRWSNKKSRIYVPYLELDLTWFNQNPWILHGVIPRLSVYLIRLDGVKFIEMGIREPAQVVKTFLFDVTTECHLLHPKNVGPF